MSGRPGRPARAARPAPPAGTRRTAARTPGNGPRRPTTHQADGTASPYPARRNHAMTTPQAFPLEPTSASGVQDRPANGLVPPRQRPRARWPLHPLGEPRGLGERPAPRLPRPQALSDPAGSISLTTSAVLAPAHRSGGQGPPVRRCPPARYLQNASRQCLRGEGVTRRSVARWIPARPDDGVRQSGGGKAVSRTPFDGAEAIGGVLPVLPRPHHVVVTAADEVPPHITGFTVSCRSG